MAPRKVRFDIDADRTGEISRTPATRNLVTTVSWFCGDTFYLKNETIEEAVSFFGSRRKIPDSVGMRIRALEKVYVLDYKYSPDNARTYILSTIRLKENGRMWADEYGTSFDWKSFCKAWKELNG